MWQTSIEEKTDPYYECTEYCIEKFRSLTGFTLDIVLETSITMMKANNLLTVSGQQHF